MIYPTSRRLVFLCPTGPILGWASGCCSCWRLLTVVQWVIAASRLPLSESLYHWRPWWRWWWWHAGMRQHPQPPPESSCTLSYTRQYTSYLPQARLISPCRINPPAGVPMSPCLFSSSGIAWEAARPTAWWSAQTVRCTDPGLWYNHTDGVVGASDQPLCSSIPPPRLQAADWTTATSTTGAQGRDGKGDFI